MSGYVNGGFTQPPGNDAPPGVPGAPSDGASKTVAYVTLATDAELTNERVLTAGTNISIVDGGAGGAVTINATTASPGAPIAAQYLTLATDATLTNERVIAAGTNISFIDNGAGGTFVISADVPLSAPISAKYLTLETNPTLTQERVLTPGAGIAFDDAGAGGALTISSTITQAPPAAPIAASYLTLSNDENLTNERVLTAGSGITLTDAGANGTLTISTGSILRTATVSITPGVYGSAEQLIAFPNLTESSLVMANLVPNTEFDGDDLSDCSISIKPETNQMRITISSDGPVVGNYKINYMVNL